MIYGNMIGNGAAPLKTVIIEDADGNQITGVVTGNEVVFTATDNDVREGMVYAGDEGVSTGTKNIPAYHTTEGARIITNGSQFVIPLDNGLHDFTKLQVIICPFSKSLVKSVAAEKVVIDENLYNVNSTDVISVAYRDETNKQIDLGISNTSGTMYILRYFTYKEEY